MTAGTSNATHTAEQAAALAGAQAALQQSLRLQEQYKRSRDVLLEELSTQSSELERLQAEHHVLATSLQVRLCCQCHLAEGCTTLLARSAPLHLWTCSHSWGHTPRLLKQLQFRVKSGRRARR